MNQEAGPHWAPNPPVSWSSWSGTLQPPELWVIHVCCLSRPVCGSSIIAAPTDKTHIWAEIGFLGCTCWMTNDMSQLLSLLLHILTCYMSWFLHFKFGFPVILTSSLSWTTPYFKPSSLQTLTETHLLSENFPLNTISDLERKWKITCPNTI